MCGLEPDDSSGDARQLSSSLITSALPRGYCYLFRIHATKPYHGINFSPTFQDPLANTRLECTEFISYGFDGFISQGSGASTGHGTTITAAVHLVCPGLEFLDRGKTRLKVPKEMAN